MLNTTKPIDVSRPSADILLELIGERNPSLPAMTQDDAHLRGLAESDEFWPTAVDREYTQDYPNIKPQAIYIAPTVDYSPSEEKFVVKKLINFKGGDYEVTLLPDNFANFYIDGELKLSGGDWDKPLVSTLNIPAGPHTIAIVCHNLGGTPNPSALRFQIIGTDSVYSDTTWPCKIIGALSTDESTYVGRSYKATCEVDLLTSPSETEGDYVKFGYERIPLETLFGAVDKDSITAGVQLPYHTSDLPMLAGSVYNFQSIFDKFYRFSHSDSGRYPAKSSELQQWGYNATYDFIESTVNSTTYVGFISDDVSDKYIFNTVVTSTDSDNDGICIVAGAFKQGDIDDKEHTLSVVTTQGGINDYYFELWIDYLQPTAKLIGGIGEKATGFWTTWKGKYAHICIIRDGKDLTVHAYTGSLPEPKNGESVETATKKMVQALSYWDEDEFRNNGYSKRVYDLSVVAPTFNKPTRYGYGQYSQDNSRFWNIRRPNDEPETTAGIKDWFMDNYGFHLGDSGVSVKPIGADRYEVSVDNYVFTGKVELTPSTVNTIHAPRRLLATGIRFAVGESYTDSAAAAEAGKHWTSPNRDVITYGGNELPTNHYAFIVGDNTATEYEFTVAVSSEGNQEFPSIVVLAAVENLDHGWDTLSMFIDTPEYAGSTEIGFWKNVAGVGATNIGGYPNPNPFTWNDVSERYAIVKRKGDIITIRYECKTGEPGIDRDITIDLNSRAELAVFKKPCRVGYGATRQHPVNYRKLRT